MKTAKMKTLSLKINLTQNTLNLRKIIHFRACWIFMYVYNFDFAYVCLDDSQPSLEEAYFVAEQGVEEQGKPPPFFDHIEPMIWRFLKRIANSVCQLYTNPLKLCKIY